MIDGRDAWLSTIAFHAVHDAIDLGRPDPEAITVTVWQRFASSADLSRGKGDIADARRKVEDKLRLARDGRLPARDGDVPEPAYAPPALSVEAAREKLETEIDRFCTRVLDWHRGKAPGMPRVGLQATVGLGKSRIAARRLVVLQRHLRDEGLPSRILLFVPSHVLAAEVAATWRGLGADVAVHLGYETSDPATGAPMCQDLEAVHAAMEAGLDIPSSVCGVDGSEHCRFLGDCLKHQNRIAVAAADVVVSAYDTLFSGLPFAEDSIGLLLIDEGCWARSPGETRGIFADDLRSEPVTDLGNSRVGTAAANAIADLVACRARLVRALEEVGDGAVLAELLRRHGLDSALCRDAARLEERRLSDPGLQPGLSGAEREVALERAMSNARIRKLMAIWRLLGTLLDPSATKPGQVQLARTRGRLELIARSVRPLHQSLKARPLLHLDATLRPELLACILPGLEVTAIEATAPHMHLRLVTGRFGKSTLCPAPGLPEEEARRRANRLEECVTYVRWQARRVAPGKVLVVTYQGCEAAFQGIPGVVTAHFNAVAGIDAFGDVALLVSIGRPLPAAGDLGYLAGVFFGVVGDGGYRKDFAGVHMRAGGPRSVVAVRHQDAQAETLRAAICDDELIQVVGRGRGVNRSADTPLDVHVLADVALPLVHDSVAPWDAVRPGIVQRMLLEGIAVDSPGDAAVLHPGLFETANQAKKMFQAAGFGGQNPLRGIQWEMTPKSAAYRRTGRGRSWQRAYWLSGDEGDVRRALEARLGQMAGWRVG